MITSLIIMKIRFGYLQKDKFGELCVRSYARLRTKFHAQLYDYKSYDYGVTLAINSSISMVPTIVSLLKARVGSDTTSALVKKHLILFRRNGY